MPRASNRVADALTVSVFAFSVFAFSVFAFSVFTVSVFAFSMFTFSMFTEIMKAIMLRMESSHVSLIPIRKEVLKTVSHMKTICHMEGADAGSVKACAAPSQSVGRAEDNSAGANSHDGYEGSRLHEFLGCMSFLIPGNCHSRLLIIILSRRPPQNARTSSIKLM
jgi:hypothetical protein